MSVRKLVLVTGGAGFIGSHMVDWLLDQGYRVRVIDNFCSGRLQNLEHRKNDPQLTVETKDIRCLASSDSIFNGAEYVFHFAGIGDIVPSIDQPVDYLSVNVMGTINVLESARHARVRKLVYAASSSCYGPAEQTPTTEEAPICLEHPYALSKYMGEQAVLHWGRVYQLPVNSIRIFNAYGPCPRTSGAYGAVFGVFLAQKLAGKSFTVVGDGKQKRDFIFVTDVVRAFHLAAKSRKVNEIYNLGTGKPQTVNHLVALLGGKAVHLPKLPGEPDCTWADISKIKRHLGWKPLVSFEEGVAIMLKNIGYWRQAPVWDKTSIKAATRNWVAFLSRRKK